MTIEWLVKITKEPQPLPILFEGQMRLEFIKEGLAIAGIGEASVILVDCDDATRTHRLCNERNQPGLASAEMMNWAKFLRSEAEAGGFELLTQRSFRSKRALSTFASASGLGDLADSRFRVNRVG
jgi:hypothetical protein